MSKKEKSNNKTHTNKIKNEAITIIIVIIIIIIVIVIIIINKSVHQLFRKMQFTFFLPEEDSHISIQENQGHPCTGFHAHLRHTELLVRMFVEPNLQLFLPRKFT
jgi:amino acid transporter